MPRDGSGAGDNAVEQGQDLVHGAGENDAPSSSGVDRSSKAAPPPEVEKGDSLEGLNASGGGSSAIGQGSGKGEKDVTVDKIAEEAGKK
ncbi:hypothetical protein BAUCODRAFT_125737 [Baudoinia panamericana UAMH 10762]|uniref:Uncharacterized protein n=1 Tax=Baudoinia panamericana (strain UAMH 10762) TaxID=717646 RepID=M2M8N6_BAUPA|nr:uncharacterized protein BAUCODRAFT_125737 [Baudoinia panamericana UAMH 10762]EMC92761.1 hypothetical protein BAUCODRAFT_125737 [Baudoinia panamericana UAMH 10762]